MSKLRVDALLYRERGAHPVLFRSGRSLVGIGLVWEAIAYFSELCDQTDRVLGSDHADTLASRNYLAGAYEAAGDVGRAILLFEQTLTDRERVLGPDHPDTLGSRNNSPAPSGVCK